MTSSGPLERRLGVGDAVVIGAGSMIGAGVFAAWAPAADAAGTGLIIGLVIAGVVAFCNAASSAQLAAIHPESGGTYVYGRRQLGPFWGHLAGWGFVVGKTASCAAMALTVGAYLWPDNDRIVAVAAVVVITAVNIGGLSRTVAVTRVLLVVSVAALVAVVVGGWSSPDASLDRLTPFDGDAYGVLQSAGFLFFAFAGYARIATLGEEVKDPAVTIPRAIPRALAAVLAVYLVVGVTALAVVPTSALGATSAPLQLVIESGRLDALSPVVDIGAGIAALGVLLNLIPGVSRTTLAMARERELPTWFAHVDTNRSLPLRAELTVAAVVIALVAVLDLRSAIGISGVAVLTYYAITNAAALTLRPEQRRWPLPIAVVGLIGCVVLVAALPPMAIATGSVTLAIGVIARMSLRTNRG
ncbi:MAG: APC family permease [Ilumatobacter sp.]|uniref:APC family permease n=1 Tax=Ilumatobacter sp. TaxID=1967498 RepID=UPI00391B3F9C